MLNYKLSKFFLLIVDVSFSIEACGTVTDDEYESGAEETDGEEESEGNSSQEESDIEEFEEDGLPTSKAAKREEKMVFFQFEHS